MGIKPIAAKSAMTLIGYIELERHIDVPKQNPVTEKPKRKIGGSKVLYSMACLAGGINVFIASMSYGSAIIVPLGLIGFGVLSLTKENF